MGYKKTGFTLIEVMMVIVIMAIISIPMTRFFKKQTESAVWESNRHSFRFDYVYFINKFRYELKLASKSTGEIGPIGTPGPSGDEIRFEFYDPVRKEIVYVGYIYNPTDHQITRVLYASPWQNPRSPSKRMSGVQNSIPDPSTPAVTTPIFSHSDDFETVTVTLAPHSRGPIQNGSMRETYSTQIAPRNP